MTHKWKRFEKIVADIQRELSPDAVVTQNEKVVGKISGEPRDVDIAIRRKIGQFELLIAVECKDYRRVLHIKDVESFAGLLEDVGANKGAMVSAKGYSKTAVRLARRKGIDLYRLVDTDSVEWKSYVTVPCVVRNLRLTWRAVFQGRREDLEGTIVGHDSIVLASDQKPLGTVREILEQMWRQGEITETAGDYGGIPLSAPARYIEVGGQFVPVRVAIDARVSVQLYFGHLPLTAVRGLTNELDGTLKATEFVTDWLRWMDIEESWRKITSPEELAVTPVLTFFLKDAPIGDPDATRSIRLLVTNKLPTGNASPADDGPAG
jgi:Restriction endonuclease